VCCAAVKSHRYTKKFPQETVKELPRVLLTDLDGRHPVAASFQKNSNTAGSHAFSQPTDHASSDQHIFHVVTAALSCSCAIAGARMAWSRAHGVRAMSMEEKHRMRAVNCGAKMS
jgi:hypothetical protein